MCVHLYVNSVFRTRYKVFTLRFHNSVIISMLFIFAFFVDDAWNLFNSVFMDTAKECERKNAWSGSLTKYNSYFSHLYRIIEYKLSCPAAHSHRSLWLLHRSHPSFIKKLLLKICSISFYCIWFRLCECVFLCFFLFSFLVFRLLRKNQIKFAHHIERAHLNSPIIMSTMVTINTA